MKRSVPMLAAMAVCTRALAGEPGVPTTRPESANMPRTLSP
jgi:hypothetical protein